MVLFFFNLQVKLYVSKLTSTKTQVPYEYYSLPFCRPKEMKLQAENLGEVISGDMIENSVYMVPIIYFIISKNINKIYI